MTAISDLISRIREVFAGAEVPVRVVEAGAPETGEYIGASLLEGVAWYDVSGDFLDANPDCVYGVSPEAFAYYLPATMILIGDGSRRHLACWNIIEMLDRPMGPELWDEYFVARWRRLGKKQAEVVQEWILWFSLDADDYESDMLARALDTVDRLSHMSTSSLGVQNGNGDV